MGNNREIDLTGKLLDMFQIAGMPVDDLRGQLPLNPRLPFDIRELEDVRGGVVHHSGGWAYATPEGLAEWCIEKRSLPGMPYTFYLKMPYPTEQSPVPWAFCHELTEWGPQAINVNNISFGICLGGNYQYLKPPIWMVDSLSRLIDVLLEYFRQEVGTELWVKPHYEVSSTVCPGRVWEMYQEYREEE